MKKLDCFMHRARKKENGEWVEGFLTHCPIFGDTFIYHGVLSEVDKDTAGRNTEIFDCKNRSIYEGMKVNQVNVLIENGQDITGIVQMIQGSWMIVDEDNKRAELLFDRASINTIVEEV